MTCCERSQQWITALQLLRRAEKQNLGMMSFDLTCLADYRAGRYVYIYAWNPLMTLVLVGVSALFWGVDLQT